MDETYDTVMLSFDDDTGVANVTLNRPESLNAMNAQMSSDIVDAFERLETADEESHGVTVWAVVVEGAGEKAFCAGADIDGFSDSNHADFHPRTKHEVIREFPAPVVAKIDGYCLGGGLELAFACDFRVASESSQLGLPEVDLGLIPGGGGVQYITRLAGPSRAKEIAMTGEHLSARSAAEHDLVNHVYPDEDFEEEAEAFIDNIAGKAPLAVRAIKDSANVAVETGFRAARQYDRRVFPTLLKTEDHAEGAAAFREDREPSFDGQ